VGVRPPLPAPLKASAKPLNPNDLICLNYSRLRSAQPTIRDPPEASFKRLEIYGCNPGVFQFRGQTGTGTFTTADSRLLRALHSAGFLASNNLPSELLNCVYVPGRLKPPVER
jgi:hypothetical protein